MYALDVWYSLSLDCWVAGWRGTDTTLGSGDTAEEAVENAKRQINKHDLTPD